MDKEAYEISYEYENEPDYKLGDVSTYALCQELRRRQGVKERRLGPDDELKTSFVGPVLILEVTD